MYEPLLNWYDAHGRHWLPWRQTRDPWAVLVAELMLQQTQVARVVPKYEAFLDRFGSPADCADAPVGEVVRAWAGLGYNRRAVNLHRAAVAVVDQHGGVLPCDLGALLALPGIGPYTARAVLAFAYMQSVCPLDVNTARPLARVTYRQPVSQAEADGLVPAGPEDAWRWNEALMDLGALVCTRRSPACPVCPLHTDCLYANAGDAAADPAAPAGRQSRFEGSDRQGRGRLVDALRDGPVAPADLAPAMGWPDDPDRAGRVAATLVADGLAERLPDGSLTLPE